jgi:hypothetical protein
VIRGVRANSSILCSRLDLRLQMTLEKFSTTPRQGVNLWNHITKLSNNLTVSYHDQQRPIELGTLLIHRYYSAAMAGLRPARFALIRSSISSRKWRTNP